MKVITIIFCVLFIGLQSCEDQIETSSFPFESVNIVGKWEIKQISGGFAGQQIYTPNFKFLTIKANGEFVFSSDSSEIAQGKIAVEENSDNEILLKFNLDDKYPFSVVNMSTYHAKNI